MRVPIWLLSTFVLLLATFPSGVHAAGDNPQLTPLVAEIIAPPHVIPGSDGRRHIVYELAVTNITGGDVRFEKLKVVDADSGAPLAELGPDELRTRVTPGASRGNENRELAAYQFAVLFLHVVLADGAAVPARITHEITAFFAVIGADMTVTIGEGAVVAKAPVALGPPLRGKGYVAADGCCDSIRHVRALLSLDGKFYLAQRFAIDWEQIDDNNTLVVGDLKVPANYHIYGKPILAVADGTVVGTRDDLQDQVPGALPANLPIDEADGNFVVLDIGSGLFVNYAHMRPGSIKVKLGDKVQRGDQIGEVGNTGNSQAPHLHLHVMDSASPLASDGLPYVFDSFTITAVGEATEDFDMAEATGSPMTLTPRVPPQKLEDVLPLDLSVVDWPQ
ncbi:M23 family metallopeptidase [Mesorhizobium sp. M7A.F.Ca.US.003.02.1.1]|uniref:M23 family metallopeptidase n=1 Tax=Mesorhizobium sp. M7A.F.Ca.US.003.02.1.1 TaxID=2496710 RepID=UPI000FCAB5C1|nr:M23 family metallopeptidase [Mesorhizobium sp. M7A.F.Ca.US.003.02.1.1]RUZ44231.1 M23 family metallopeptidase [Mesorhizobium sp. M7A.F.Ca.US.003.02.1.1]